MPPGLAHHIHPSRGPLRQQVLPASTHWQNSDAALGHRLERLFSSTCAPKVSLGCPPHLHRGPGSRDWHLSVDSSWGNHIWQDRTKTAEFSK